MIAYAKYFDCDPLTSKVSLTLFVSNLCFKLFEIDYTGY